MKIATLLLAALLFPTATLLSQPPQKDVAHDIDTARNYLKDASARLEQAGDEWGGHRVKALQHIQQAIAELNEAEKFAREHHDVK